MAIGDKTAIVKLSTVMLEVAGDLRRYSGSVQDFAESLPGLKIEFEQMSQDFVDLAQKLDDAVETIPSPDCVSVVQALPAPQLIAMYTDQMDRLYELIQLSMRPQYVVQDGPYTDQEVDGLMAKVRGES